ncbi:MAG: protein translocase subunit SecD [Phycisphaerales bacterium]|jgi:SecD/SecF fusion protein|nr:protein translocase subunit SecD [Phycisphaerales bacterium]
MSNNHSGRVFLILAILAIALWAIFPTGNFTHPNLKPGIDMAGGTSLLYEIKAAPGTSDENLAIKVMESLKKRVDPQGVRNLIWRPQGNNRLEIQMPSSGNSEENRKLREAYLNAQRELEATNIRAAEVIGAVEEGNQARLDELTEGSAVRKKLFAELLESHKAIQAAQANKDFKAQADAEMQYDQLKLRIDETNLSASDLEQILELNPDRRDQRLKELKEKYADFPNRLKAIDQMTKQSEQFDKVRGNIDDAAELKRLLRGSGVLEFHILVTESSSEVQAMVQRLKQKGPAPQAGDQMRWYQVDRPEEFKQQHEMLQMYNDKYYVLAYDTAEKSMTHRPGGVTWGLQQAYSTRIEKGFAAQKAVGFQFDSTGAALFADLTRGNVGKPLAIVLDNKVISAPNINEAITGGSGTISGGGANGFTDQELNYLINTLNAGSLPAQLAEEPIREQTIGPQLGADNLRRGLMSCVVGLIAVSLLMIVYYHMSGLVAVVALVLNIVLILGSMAALGATFTLPAIAGIVLTMGIAVDANVLIFERLREEQSRGLSLRMGLRNAYDRALSAIVDSNVTTLITCVVLYYFGSEEVKGFGLTLAIGLLSSLFTSLFVTKTIFGIWLDHFGLKKLGSLPVSIPAVARLLHPNVDWMGKIGWFITVSAVLLVSGMTALVVKYQQGKLLDIEFASGTSVQFELKQPLTQPEVLKLLETKPSDIPSPSVVTVGDTQREYEVVTANADSSQVRNAILEVMGDRLKLELPSQFDGADRPINEVVDTEVLPIQNTSFSVNNFKPRSVADYQGGVAIVLRNLTPALSLKEIRSRVERQQLQPRPDGSQPPFHDFKVESDVVDQEQPVSWAVILTSDTALPYSADPAKWRDDLAGPFWQIVNEAISKPAQLNKVSNFDAQVAGETSRDALLAVVFSALAIMVYIWLRFGDLRYGTATIVATVHDTFMVVGFIGLSHYLGQTAVGHALLIEPFRVNLTVVAAVLTVLGYSMVDTIVVFDRIRENRGRFGHLSRQVINDSINQTLSRTLLTSGTTLTTVAVMYLLGGPAIHGFTFVMLVGIFVGTYSSIAIASPILLWGGKKEHEAATGKASAGQLQKAGR